MAATVNNLTANCTNVPEDLDCLNLHDYLVPPVSQEQVDKMEKDLNEIKTRIENLERRKIEDWMNQKTQLLQRLEMMEKKMSRQEQELFFLFRCGTIGPNDYTYR